MYTRSFNDTVIETLVETLRKSIVIFDGAMGTELYRRGIFTNQCFDDLNLNNPKLVQKVHRSYLDAGADVLTTNTIGANPLSLKKHGIADRTAKINAAGVQVARQAIAEFRADNAKYADKSIYVAASVGAPLFEEGETATDAEIQNAMAAQILALLDAGADFILFETLRSLDNAKNCFQVVARIQSERNEEIPFILSFRPTTKNTTLETLSQIAEIVRQENYPRPFAWGLNCGLGPDEILETVEAVLGTFNVPWVIQPCGGAPRQVENRSIYMNSPEYFREYVQRYVTLGAKGVGGCCNVGPEHIREMAKAVKPLVKARRGEVNLQPEQEGAVLCEAAPLAERSALGARLAARKWITSVELTPPRGYDLEPTLEKCRRLKALGIHCLNIPDGPRASSRISAMVVADRIQNAIGIETILHFCCRDRNLIGMQADMLGCAACGIHNILFITGDPPKLGDYPDATGVFDTDSIGATRILQRLNRGVDLGGAKLPCPTRIAMGVGLDPTALDRNREVDRFFKKVEAGAEIAITQPVFDPETLLDILQQVRSANIPILAGIWPFASYRNATFMQTEVPGVSIPASIMERMRRAETKEAQVAEGIQIAREAIEQIRSEIAGVQVSAPLGNIDIVMGVLEGNIRD